MLWIAKKKMDSLIAISRGSCQAPVFLEAKYTGDPDDMRPVMLIGQGTTYSCGGLCLTGRHEQNESKSNISGAAMTIAVLKACAALSLPISVVALIPIYDYMISGKSMKMGDIMKSLNGKNVNISDTRNEGRVIVGDTITWGQEVHKPRLILDFSTEATGMKAGLGQAATGVFSNSHIMWQLMHKAGSISGDRVWRMPLWKYYNSRVTSDRRVDICNKGVGYGSPCLAAAFLSQFVDCVDWLHLDIEGVGKRHLAKDTPYLRVGEMSGRPTRTIIEFLYQIACPHEYRCKEEEDMGSEN